jgi:aspartate aminotransferase-like enzyme/GNAT superfamily N-acetyltransferase
VETYRFKAATEAWELEALERLNHDTFTAEIPQHPTQTDGHLRDRFHAENHYIVALHGEEVVGMVALRAGRPFSLDAKLPDLDRYLPPHRSLCEVRLLAIKPAHRRPGVFRGLLESLVRECGRRGHDMAVISGALRQAKLYHHMGFENFGPVVGTAEAPYQPMFLKAEVFDSRFAGVLEFINFLPGPVPISLKVRKALARPAQYHRGPIFRTLFEGVREDLKVLAGAPFVQILVGSGTLANETVAAQLSLLEGPGLVLSNGEFGDRLLEQAQRWRMKYRAVRSDWGKPLDLDLIAKILHEEPRARWIWAVHGETSTGILNSLDDLKTLSHRHGADLALDCVSTLGAVPLDLRGVRFATAASGKALAGFPGLAIAFHDRPLEPSEYLPRYLDLGTWDRAEGTPFTHSSNLVAALAEALKRFKGDGPFTALAAQGLRLRQTCQALGLPVLAAPEWAHPSAITLALPPEIPASAFGEAMLAKHIQLGWQSGYLRERNWIQVCVMVPHPEEDFTHMLRALGEVWRGLAG